MDFTGYQYPSDIILQAVRYYVLYKLSTRDIEEIFTERDSAIDHLTINRWVITFAPTLEHKARQLKRKVLSSWRKKSKDNGGITTEPLINMRYR